MMARMRRVFAGIVVVLLITALSVACTYSPIPSQSPATEQVAIPAGVPKIGEQIQIGHWDYTITHVDRQQAIPAENPNSLIHPKGVWQVVYLKVTNQGQHYDGIKVMDLQLKDTQGNLYDVDLDSSIIYSENNKLTVPGHPYKPGETGEMGFVFDILPTLHGLSLHLPDTHTDIALGQ